jgi:hypothetical protein
MAGARNISKDVDKAMLDKTQKQLEGRGPGANSKQREV